MDNKTSHKGTFFEIEMYASSESWMNNISIDLWFVMIGQYLKIWNLRVQKKSKYWENHEVKIKMKFLTMHINNQKCILIYLRYKISSWSMILIS